ncbi:small subunit ribosomal protein S30e [Pelomyxa schiedti]|nr:small subunit ribosomal protein S30e [Pelomyxa schiedti]
MGKVHGGLARAGKVRAQTPVVPPTDKKKAPRGRAHKRLLYNQCVLVVMNISLDAYIYYCRVAQCLLTHNAIATGGLLLWLRLAFPARAFIQVFEDSGELPPDYQLVADELASRGVPVTIRHTEDILRPSTRLPLTRADLVVGNFDWTRVALAQLGIAPPRPPDYPACLEPFLRRRVWRTTLGQARELLRRGGEGARAGLFIKPAEEAKAFAAIIEPRDQMLDTILDGMPGVIEPRPASTPVYCSELVTMAAEHRVYLVNGEIRAVCQYTGPKGGSGPQLDMGTVREAVRVLFGSEEGAHLVGCAMDFAVLGADKGHATCLVEVNDGFSLGSCQVGAPDEVLSVSRWLQ